MDRTYQRTHPWIRFELDLRRLPPDLWMTLGECRSKCEHIAGVPLSPDWDQQLHAVYLAKGTAATTAIEGNTLTEEQVLQQIKGELVVPASKEYLKQEVANILNGFNSILAEIAKGRVPALTRQRIEMFNATILHKLDLVNDKAVPGQIRDHSVGVERANYRGAPAEDCEYLVDRLCDWLNVMEFPDDFLSAGAMIKAVLAHLYLAWIHPFGDGNGRTARLIEVQILMCSGIPSPAAHLLSNHYNDTRTEYYAQLNRASKSGGDVVPFLLYALRGFRDGLRQQIQYVKTLQHKIAWTNYVHEAFSGRKSVSDHRRRRLALELADHPNGVKLDAVKTINGVIALEYASKTGRTLMRDLRELSELKLITVRDRIVFPNRDLILAFLPVRARLEKREKATVNPKPIAMNDSSPRPSAASESPHLTSPTGHEETVTGR